MLLAMSDDEELLYESLSNIRVETSLLQTRSIPSLLHSQLFGSMQSSYIGQPFKSLEYIRGHETIVKQALAILSQSFLPFAIKQRLKQQILPSTSLMIEGNVQSGKTTILQVISRVSSTSTSTLCHVIHLDGKKLKSLPTNEIRQILTHAFQESESKAPAMIAIDHVEVI